MMQNYFPGKLTCVVLIARRLPIDPRFSRNYYIADHATIAAKTAGVGFKGFPEP
jgi:hypothetical protein